MKVDLISLASSLNGTQYPYVINAISFNSDDECEEFFNSIAKDYQSAEYMPSSFVRFIAAFVKEKNIEFKQYFGDFITSMYIGFEKSMKDRSWKDETTRTAYSSLISRSLLSEDFIINNYAEILPVIRAARVRNKEIFEKNKGALKLKKELLKVTNGDSHEFKNKTNYYKSFKNVSVENLNQSPNAINWSFILEKKADEVTDEMVIGILRGTNHNYFVDYLQENGTNYVKKFFLEKALDFVDEVQCQKFIETFFLRAYCITSPLVDFLILDDAYFNKLITNFGSALVSKKEYDGYGTGRREVTTLYNAMNSETYKRLRKTMMLAKIGESDSWNEYMKNRNSIFFLGDVQNSYYDYTPFHEFEKFKDELSKNSYEKNIRAYLSEAIANGKMR